MDNKELSRSIVNSLKAAGIKRRAYSIKCEYCGYSSAATITVKDLHIKLSDIENAVNSFEKIDRDERTGEILEGGNTYVFIDYDYDMMENAISEKLELANSLRNKALENNNEGFLLAENNSVKVILFAVDGIAYMFDKKTSKTIDRTHAIDQYQIARILVNFENKNTIR